MIKQFLIAVVLLVTVSGFSQDGGTASPYSFYGIGNQQFRGTSENRSMGGLSTFSDSLHLNVVNPAALGRLRFVTFTFGASHTELTSKDNTLEDNASATSIDYFAFGFPLTKKLGVGFGLMPFTSVGYRINGDVDETVNRFSGRGGLNRVYLSAGYEVFKGLTVGGSANYNFGNIQNESLRTQENVELGTLERNRSDLSGLTLDFGAQYERLISNDLTLSASVGYTPGTTISSDNTRSIASVNFNDEGQTNPVDEREIDVADTDFNFPSSVTLGLGVGQKNKWFLGGEYTRKSSSDFTNRSFEIDNVTFEDASQFRLGGFYVPKYNSVTSYLQRITYRAGLRYEESGTIIDNEDINEFGISFGLGLPAGRLFSNANLGIEYGQRGTTNAGLVEETFFNFFLSFSLNDIWFQKTKFN
ncbi:hypothetical protein EAX61_09185 [Dokdonia sinensis]|uniref:Uncharacterized protein n=1 Tax=Dokdonia sinensis TaxID=2479847 RepID=A0A3M0G3S4_9FLAO|nr:hypothetical protein [Dokdonia sinensis]RMB59218.1 hypothetical protein EAX61_09185 [Dokdonia sinensis]